MSDDRMDRAERIRNMREGTRSTDRRDDAAAEAADEESSSADAASAGSQATAAAETRTGSTTADTQSDSGASSDAQAAAQRAAESAVEVMGAGSGTAPEADMTSETGAAVGAETGTDDAGAGESPAIPAGATGASTVPGDVSGVELPDQQLLEEAMATSSVESTEGGARAAMEGDSTQSEEVVRVLEFSLGEEYYCLDIEYVEEIVKRSTVTRVPNTPEFVDGVVDLRGQITTILEPKEMMDIESEGDQNLIIVFDPEQFEDQGAIGWVVDEVRQVVPIPESEVNHPPVDAEYINGVVDREEYDQFVIWIEPEDALAQATATEDG